MNFIIDLFPADFIQALGWTLFHSIWQGFLVAIILLIGLKITDDKSAKFRYALSFAALMILLFSSGITFYSYYNDPQYSVTIHSYLTKESLDKTQDNLNTAQIDSTNKSFLLDDAEKLFSNNLQIIVAAWLIGFIIFTFRFCGGLIYISRLKNVNHLELPNHIKEKLDHISSRLLNNKKLHVFESIHVSVPLTIGFLKPIILFPIGLISSLPIAQIEAILAHEIAHIKRYDFFVNIIQSIAETILFYHPVVWWISSVIRNERENCCDDIAIKLCMDRIAYSNALINIQQLKASNSILAIALNGKESNLFRRIKRMNETKNSRTNYGIKFAVFSFLILFIAVVSLLSTSTYGSKTDFNKASLLNSFLPHNIENAESYDESLNVSSKIPDTTSIKKGKRTFRFNEEKNGDRIRYKAKLNDGKIEKLYVDGEEVPENELRNYQSMVNEKIDNYEKIIAELNQNKKQYGRLLEEYAEKMKNYREKLKDYRQNRFEFELDHNYTPDLSELRESLRELKRSMKHNFADKDFVVPPLPPIHFPPIEVPQIEIPEINIPPIKIDVPHFDKEGMKKWKKEFKENMKEFELDMKKHQFDMQEFKMNMEKFKIDMSDFKANMKDFGEEMKKFGQFMDVMKEELIKDKIISSKNDLEDLLLSEEKMIVNGEKISQQFHSKYLSIYEKLTGKKLEGNHKIQFND